MTETALPRVPPDTPLDAALCDSVVDASLRHLAALVGPRGKFVYAHPAGRPDAPLAGYNMLRHCGTLWFMLRSVNRLALPVDDALAQAMIRGVGYAAARLESPGWTGADAPALALVTKGAIKLGGIGLALVMLHEYRDFLAARGLSDSVLPLPPEATIHALETYALTQVQDGDFLHKRALDTGAVFPFRSDYYTGEALFGLYASGRDLPAAQAVGDALMAQDYGIDIQSHWMAYAACEAADRTRAPLPLVRGYLERLTARIIADPGYRNRRESTPVACRSEALTRFLLLADRWHGTPRAFDAALVAQARIAAQDNLRLQLEWYDGGQFRRGDTSDKVQIDYIQHNATAFANWRLHLSGQPA
ncbi:MAG TPA: hypothetical protein VLA78_02170 [Paracoccaceae bacterium]|nr:hypothetical protein [Paracoccaceae bacterium]